NGADWTVLENSGNTGLAEFDGHYYLYDPTAADGSDGTTLKFGGEAVSAGAQSDNGPIAVEQTATGYEVAWKVDGTDQYNVWATDSDGNFVKSLTGNVSGDNPLLEIHEMILGQDLNGDGVTGFDAQTWDQIMDGVKQQVINMLENWAQQQSDPQSLVSQSSVDNIVTDLLGNATGSLPDPTGSKADGSSGAGSSSLLPVDSHVDSQSGATENHHLVYMGQLFGPAGQQADTSDTGTGYGQSLMHPSGSSMWSDHHLSADVLAFDR
ncbi:MAG: hypothetical protein FWD68_17865, partial [Alphaproteobacteria bacterium]|nr:hypothetical protein [Alphaproteobacteria bacterium]